MFPRRFVTLSMLMASVSAFSFQRRGGDFTSSTTTPAVISRDTFVTRSTVGILGTTSILSFPKNAQARGRATLEQAYERYAPRIKAGGDFYQNELKTLIAKGDWQGIENALQEPPSRVKTDLQKADAGVAERGSYAWL